MQPSSTATTSRKTGKFARLATDLSEEPPATNVRYFYASSTSIDDPTAPVPPPIAQPATAKRLPLCPFSGYDTTALDQAWNELRRNLDKYREEKEASDLTAKGAASGRASSLRSKSLAGRNRGHSLDAAKAQRRGQHTWPAAFSSRDRRSSSSRRESVSGNEASKQHTTVTPSRLRDSANYGEIDPEEQGLTGRPFARAPSRNKVATSRQMQAMNVEDRVDSAEASDTAKDEPPSEAPSKAIPVGLSRLHEVTMPSLQMRPIYWNPVNDISAVVRATWFYKDTMLPVEVEVANMLERGYLDLRPWTQTWSDELNSACKVGAIGEEKITHTLWPDYDSIKPHSRSGTAMSSAGLPDEDDTPEKRRQDLLESTANIIDVSTSDLDVDNKASGGFSLGPDSQKRMFLASQIMYVNETDAYIMRPSLAPSAYYGRRPLANYIRKGRSLGIPVVRGFDPKAWSKLNPPKPVKCHATAQSAVSGHDNTRPSVPRGISDPTLSRTSHGQVTDLVLVIHGIGQKLSERVESYHFTHAMNAFRRAVNVEMLSPSVKPHLRKEMGGLMVLPVNWRSSLSFDDGGYKDGREDPSENQYSLKDITPESLPSVRSIISDVMLDIPYYLSHHQPRMIAAVIEEANRIYRAWCTNNPGFEKYGRVHIIAHSLGSVMAMDILSRQPTTTSYDPHDTSIKEHFAFPTHNLYICGSPAGFFLLLKKANLRPRGSRQTSSPNREGDDPIPPGVTGHQGDYGCLAISKIYNIINPYDPVAYRLNAAVDASYASTLKPAFIPSASSSWYSFSNPFSSSSSNPSSTSAKPNRPTPTARLPSNVELETHNFTREEIAENRAYLLNDNGQIDFFLRYGGGALEIQYLTMLGAHSSYWTSRDFVRFVVLETGRRAGKGGTLEGLKAVKKKGAAG